MLLKLAYAMKRPHCVTSALSNADRNARTQRTAVTERIVTWYEKVYVQTKAKEQELNSVA